MMNEHSQIDGNSGNQLEFTNAISLETDISIRDDEGHKHVGCFGGDDTTTYYILSGGMREIHWKKGGGTVAGILILFDDKGNQISVNRGENYSTNIKRGIDPIREEKRSDIEEME